MKATGEGSRYLAENEPARRKTLTNCFEAARQRFQNEIANDLIAKDQKRGPIVARFLNGVKLTELKESCKELSDKAEDRANNNAARLWTTLDQFKAVGDVFLQFAPESVSMVWFGISSLITIASARVQTRLLICGTCDSIANIIGDCVRWEARMQTSQNREGTPNLDIWESDMPDLIFGILDFLWGAQPHFNESKVIRIGNSVKDLFTRDLQKKTEFLLQKYEEIVKRAQAHFEESVFQESLRGSAQNC
ncbi:hypothetical protein ABW20_dc0103989 [Dactylellina cionopaga]|nr:hypothetical protein ABW20_dc0103989 [Dactylellina cionopaga]